MIAIGHIGAKEEVTEGFWAKQNRVMEPGQLCVVSNLVAGAGQRLRLLRKLRARSKTSGARICSTEPRRFGDLGSSSSVSVQRKKPHPMDETVFLVAGAGLEPATFGL